MSFRVCDDCCRATSGLGCTKRGAIFDTAALRLSEVIVPDPSNSALNMQQSLKSTARSAQTRIIAVSHRPWLVSPARTVSLRSPAPLTDRQTLPVSASKSCCALGTAQRSSVVLRMGIARSTNQRDRPGCSRSAIRMRTIGATTPRSTWSPGRAMSVTVTATNPGNSTSIRLRRWRSAASAKPNYAEFPAIASRVLLAIAQSSRATLRITMAQPNIPVVARTAAMTKAQ